MSSGSVFSATLQTITSTKLEELADQRRSFEQQYSDLLAVTRHESDPLKRLFLLVDGAKSCLGVKTVVRKTKDGRLGRVVSGGTSNARLETDLKNLDRFLEQARYDPSVSPKVLQDWEKSILQYLSVQSYKYQYADLYGKLVTEWLSSEKVSSIDGDVEMAESFEELPGAKKLDSRTEWEKAVFEPANVDPAYINNYLEDLFLTGKKDATRAIHALRDKVELFANSMTGNSHFNVDVLRWVIQGLQSSDLLSNEKREVLKDFTTNNVILGEIADVLNMRMSALNRWTWGDYVAVEQRRNLNGIYSIHMDEDLLQAIFLHYVGVKWSVFFKGAFLTLRQEIWKSNQAVVSKTDRERREYYLGPTETYKSPNIQEERSNTHRKSYYVYQLLDHDSQRIEVGDGEEEAAFDEFVQAPKQHQMVAQSAHRSRQMQQHHMPRQAPQRAMAAQPAAQLSSFSGTAQYPPVGSNFEMDMAFNDATPAPAQAKKPMEAKQSLLHLLSTEIIVNTRLHGELTCFRSVFESWNPLLPHQSIIAVLEFFGVTELWLTFFKTFLRAPLKFVDDKSSTPRPRQRGTPGSHALSDVFGEALLFCLDFSVNQSTDGALLYRTYDDFWFWSPDYEKCAKAWASVLHFTKVMGVQLSDAKTGSVRIAPGEALDLDQRLPAGQIRWGFLYLDPSTGRFEIDKKMVDSHVEELRKQLSSKSKSVIDWIQAWNSYAATFFSSNFGKAANCFGREHVDKMLATHRRIQESIFEGGNVVQFLKKTIEERFSVKDIPDGFLFFPAELGGLDLKSPFIGLLQIREAVKENPHDLIDEFEELEAQDYDKAKSLFDNGYIKHTRSSDEELRLRPEHHANTFFPFEEFARHREEFRSIGGADLINVYRELMRRPTEESIDVSVQVSQALNQLRGQSNLKGIVADWNGMEPYYKWVSQMYGPEMIERFGGLNIVDPGLLPIGMVGMFRQKRTKWQG